MKTKIYEIKQFTEIYDKIKDTTLPIKLGYRLARLAAEAQKEMDIYQSQLQKLILEYGARDENGELVHTDDGLGIKIKDGKIEECQEKINELATVEIDLNIKPISLEMFDDNIKLSIDEIKCLSPFLDEE